MPGWDCVAWYESAAKSGYVDVAAVVDRTHQVSGDNIFARDDGKVVAAFPLTAGIANFVRARFRQTRDADWNEVSLGASDQTGEHRILKLNYPVKTQDILAVQADNGNNAQVEAMLLCVAYGVEPNIRLEPGDLPANARWVRGTHSSTMVAGNWTRGVMTWSMTFDRSKTYRVLGMISQGATVYGTRLMYMGSSPSVGYAPGFVGHDTLALSFPIYADMGRFKGDQPPDIESLCSAGDTAGVVELLIAEE